MTRQKSERIREVRVPDWKAARQIEADWNREGFADKVTVRMDRRHYGRDRIVVRAYRHVEDTTPRDECQICEGDFAMKERARNTKARGHLVHHGFKRPGDGYLYGQCPGAHHLPFPAYDVIEILATQVRREADRVTKLAEEMTHLRVIVGENPQARSYRDRYEWSLLPRAEALTYIENFDSAKAYRERMTLDAVERDTKARLSTKARHLTAEAERLERRLARAKEMNG